MSNPYFKLANLHLPNWFYGFSISKQILTISSIISRLLCHASLLLLVSLLLEGVIPVARFIDPDWGINRLWHIWLPYRHASQCVAWRAITTTICRSRLYPPSQVLWLGPLDVPNVAGVLVFAVVFAVACALIVSGVITEARICKRLRSPGIDSKESMPQAYVAWRAGTSRVAVPARHAWNRFGLLKKVYKYGLWLLV